MNESDRQASVIETGVAAGAKVAFEDSRKWWMRWIVIAMLVTIVISEAADYFKFGLDSTDGASRSNLSLHIDAMTGCHYIGGPNGGLTPRLDREGQHICK